MSLFRKSWPALKRVGELAQTGENRGHDVVTETPFTMYGSCQPMDGKAVQNLPVGRVDLGKIKIFTKDVLTVSEEATENVGDVVVYAGRHWEVIWLAPWQNGVISHNEYVAEYRGLA